MIKIVIKGKSKQFIFDEMNNIIDNTVKQNIAKQLKENTKDLKCKVHKDKSFGTIYINLENLKVEYGEFCCNEYKTGI